MRRMKEMQQTGGGGMFGMGIFLKCIPYRNTPNHDIGGRKFLIQKTAKKRTFNAISLRS